MQIVNITDPANPTAVASITDGDTYTELYGARGIAIHTVGGNHYALVASYEDDGVQIIDITDPENPSAVAAITDGADYPGLGGAWGIATHTIGGSHYALVASQDDNGVQIIDITDPENPSAVAAITDGSTYTELDGASGIAIHTIGSSHYALVASQDDDGVQIIDITDPENPSAVAAITDGSTYTELDGAFSITTHTVGSSHYALVAAYNDDGVQIIDITTPASPSPVVAITDGEDYPELIDAISITTHSVGSSHYALVSSYGDSGVQIIDITNPDSPSPVADITDSAKFPVLFGAIGIATHTVGSSHYALVSSNTRDGVQIIDITDPENPFDPLSPYVELDVAGDRRAIYADSDNTDANLVFEYTVRDEDGTADLAYKATTSLKLGNSTLEDADNGADLSGATLPAPGAANSFSANKEISLNNNNTAPTVTAGDDDTVDEGDTVTLSGMATDADAADTLTYTWTQTTPATPAITITNSDALTATFTAPAVDSDTAFTFTLTVSDSTVTVTDTVTITVDDVPATTTNTAPTVSAGADDTVDEGDTVTLSGTATDADAADTLTYTWTQTTPATPAITITNSDALTATFTAPAVDSDTAFTFTLTVSDSTVTVTDTVTITVDDVPANTAPTVSAGADDTVDEGDTVTLSGTATDADAADTLTYTWTQTTPATPAITITNSDALTATFTAPDVDSDTAFTFTLTVSDSTVTVTDTVTITVDDVPATATNTAPTVSAGADDTVDEGDTVTLSGTATDCRRRRHPHLHLDPDNPGNPGHHHYQLGRAHRDLHRAGRRLRHRLHLHPHRLRQHRHRHRHRHHYRRSHHRDVRKRDFHHGERRLRRRGRHRRARHLHGTGKPGEVQHTGRGLGRRNQNLWRT